MFCRYFGFAADWENWGENDRMSEGAGKEKNFSLRFSRNDRTIEVIKLFIIWHQKQKFQTKIR